MVRRHLRLRHRSVSALLSLSAALSHSRGTALSLIANKVASPRECVWGSGAWRASCDVVAHSPCCSVLVLALADLVAAALHASSRPHRRGGCRSLAAPYVSSRVGVRCYCWLKAQLAIFRRPRFSALHPPSSGEVRGLLGVERNHGCLSSHSLVAWPLVGVLPCWRSSRRSAPVVSLVGMVACCLRVVDNEMEQSMLCN